MEKIYIPAELREILSEQEYTVDSIGLSGSKVLIYSDRVLKIRPVSQETKTEITMMKWASARGLPTPECLLHTEENGLDYLLMSKTRGKMACDDEHMKDPELLVSILSDAMKKLWETDITDCPIKNDLDKMLSAASLQVKTDKVDIENTEPDTFGDGGFESPAHLLAWLEENRPLQDLVLSHGDFCLPNVFIENGTFSGFVDIGRMGIADRWHDIALCWRSLKNNYSGKYTGKVYKDFDPDILFDALGIEPDRDKLRYYILLDELF